MKQKQLGVALVVSLIMLVLLTIIGLAAIRTGSMEQKMAVNERDTELAFQAAETSLRDTEAWLLSQTQEPLPTDDGSTRVWQLEIMDPDTGNPQSWWQERDAAWWTNNAIAYGSALDNINTPPKSITEFEFYKPDDLSVGDGNPPSGTVFYRVTSRGTGGSDNARILLQSTVAKRY